MKKIISALLTLLILTFLTINVCANSKQNYAAETTNSDLQNLNVNAKSAILMEATTGKILYSQNENEKNSPASVTKIMTLLLVMEAVEKGKISESDNVSISSYASSMGGSQVFLEEGESMSVEELIKCTVIASANDGAVALAEYVAGSEKLFVARMNDRAKELGLKNTYFENVTGLDDTTLKHLTSAHDIALMSKELLKYDLIKKYSSLWQDTIRNGEFTLTNTNRLVRYYDGCNGLKTGSTDKAGYCISATAKRDGLELIAVIMGAESRDVRNTEARKLLDFGFANYDIYSDKEENIKKAPVISGEERFVELYSAPFNVIIEKGQKIEKIHELPNEISAPIEAGKSVGKVIYKIGETVIGEGEIYSKTEIRKITVSKLFITIIQNIFSKKE